MRGGESGDRLLLDFTDKVISQLVIVFWQLVTRKRHLRCVLEPTRIHFMHLKWPPSALRCDFRFRKWSSFAFSFILFRSRINRQCYRSYSFCTLWYESSLDKTSMTHWLIPLLYVRRFQNNSVIDSQGDTFPGYVILTDPTLLHQTRMVSSHLMLVMLSSLNWRCMWYYLIASFPFFKLRVHFLFDHNHLCEWFTLKWLTQIVRKLDGQHWSEPV